MKVIWANEPPITTDIIMEQLGKKKMEPPNHYHIVVATDKTGFCKNRKGR